MANKPYLYLHTPTPLFKARVNMATVTYPVSSLVYDGVTLGAFADITFDATLLLGTFEGGDDLGRVRVKSLADVNSIPIGRASQGIEDGMLDVQDNAFITVLHDYRVWAKLPYFDLDAGIDYKDGDVPPGDFTTTGMVPKANCGAGAAGYIDPVTELMTVTFPHDGINTSFAVTDGATITTYAWFLDGGSLVSGSLSDAVITATFPAGFYWVALTVTDSNGVTHTSRCPVLAIDPTNDPTIQNFHATQRLTIEGNTLDLEIFSDILRTEIPDGTLVMYWWDEAFSPTDRNHIKFIGWTDSENFSVRRIKQGVTKSTSLHCVDVAGRMRLLPGFPQALERFVSEELGQWSHMPTLDMHKALMYIGFWHGTGFNLADFILPDDLRNYDTVRLDANGGNLFDQLSTLADKIVPDHYVCINTLGQMEVKPNWMYQDEADRPEVTVTLTENEYNNLQGDYSRHPKYHSLRSGAVLVSEDFVEIEGEDTVPTVYSIAPGISQAFTQGLSEANENEGLTLSQEQLNSTEGHRFALLNSRYGSFSFQDPSGFLFWEYEPASLQRVELELSESLHPQRGLGFTSAAGQIQEITVRLQRSNRGIRTEVTCTWKKEELGSPAATYIPDVDEEVGYEPPPPDPFVPPLPDDPDTYFGDIEAYVVWDGATVLRTWDLQEASPVWEEIGASLSGIIYDVQYMHVDEDTVGAWCMTSTGIYFCGDIMAVTPTWDEVLTLATVQSIAFTPVVGEVIFASMTHYWLQPGHLCVAMSLSEEDDGYLHAWYWVTEDYGVNWTPVDMSEFLFTSDAATRAYYQCGRFGLASFRSSPIIWCGRGNGRTGTNGGDGAVFKSVDGGYTWTKEYIFLPSGRVSGLPAILNPYPDINDPSYITVAIGGTSPVAKMYKSEDGWSSGSLVTEPAGHAGGFSTSGMMMRPNKNPHHDLHVLCIFAIDSSSNGDLYESNDGGSTWDLLEGFNNSTVTPNGWPPDPDQWVVIDNQEAALQVRLTLDNFATLLDKTGNIPSLIEWDGGFIAGGFALPKVDEPPTAPELMPAWYRWVDDETVLEFISVGPAESHSHTVIDTIEVPTETIAESLVLAPPATAVRVEVSGTWTAQVIVSGGINSSGLISIFDDTFTSVVTDMTYDHPDNNTSTSQNFTATITKSLGATWPKNRDYYEFTPPSSPEGLRWRMSAAGNAFGEGSIVTIIQSVSLRVTEIELDDGTIYSPHS